jgi:hypothetical protein
MSTTAAAAAAKRRVRRQKIFLAVGTVCLLGVLGFELPKMLGRHGNQSSVGEATTASPIAAVASPVAAAVALRDTDRFAVQRDTDQLLSFGLFKSKDPFVQQLATTAAPTAAAPSAPPAAVHAPTKKATTSATPGATGKTSTVQAAPSVVVNPAPSPTSTTPAISPTTVPATPPPATPTAPPAAPASALLSTNGVCEQVGVKATFPATENIFVLVEIAENGKSVKIAIAGGSYDSGQATATIKLGQKLTLVNTSDGSRYVISLEAKCAVIAPGAASASAPASASASSAGASAAAPPAPTPPTSTTPIVTDPYDTTPPPSG